MSDLPRADEAEDALVGAVILAPDMLPAVREIVRPADFFQSEPRDVFAIVCGLADVRQPLDVLTVAEVYATKHRNNGHPKLIVADLAQGCPVPGNATTYAERVRDAALQRRLIERAAEVVRESQSDTPPEQVAEYAALAFGEIASGRRRDSASGYVTGDALRAAPPPAPSGIAWTVTETGEAIIRDGLRYLVVGEAGIGKSLLALGACIEAAAAGEVAVFLDAEGDLPTFVRRLHMLTAGPLAVGLVREPTLADCIFYRTHDGHDSPLALPEGTRLVVLDGLGSAIAREQLDENSAADFLGFLARVVDPLRRKAPEAAFIIIDHPGHADPARGRGSSAKRPAVDIELTLKATGHDRSALIVRKDRHAVLGVPVGRTVAEVRRFADDGGVTLELREPDRSTDAEGNFRPTVLMGRVADYLARQTAGVSMTQVVGGVQGKDQGIRAAVAALVREGCAREDDGARHARVFSYVKHPTTPASPVGRGQAREEGR